MFLGQPNLRRFALTLPGDLFIFPQPKDAQKIIMIP